MKTLSVLTDSLLDAILSIQSTLQYGCGNFKVAYCIRHMLRTLYTFKIRKM